MRSNSRKQIEERAELFAYYRAILHISSIVARLSSKLDEVYPFARRHNYERRIERWNARPRRRSIKGGNHR